MLTYGMPSNYGVKKYSLWAWRTLYLSINRLLDSKKSRITLSKLRGIIVINEQGSISSSSGI